MTQPLPAVDPALQRRLAQGLAAVEARLNQVASSDDPMIQAPATHLLNAGGKRMRAQLTLLAAELGDPTAPGIIDAAVVVELTHLATLYHDDVIDEASLRRGVMAAHKAYSNSQAILTGDWLFAKSSAVVAELGPQAVQLQALAFTRLCEGQIHEVIGPAPGQDPISHHIKVLSDKTGALIATAAHFGAWLAGASPGVIDSIVRFAEKVGVAFQLADDVIDLTADAALAGKTPGTDLREQVPTMPRLLLDAAAAQDRTAGLATSPAIDLAGDIAADLSDDAILAGVVRRLCAHPVMDQARQLAAQWADQAVADLAQLPVGAARSALEAFARMAVARLA